MKKSVKFLLPFLVLSSVGLSSCDTHKTFLTFGNTKMEDQDIYDSNNNYIYNISYGDLENKIVNKTENFMVAVSVPSCVCWATFSDILNEYMVETNTICYKINYSEIANEQNKFGIKISEGNPSFALFEDGNLVKTICYTVNKPEMTDYNKFKKMMNKLVDFPRMYYSTWAEVNAAQQTSSNKISVLYARSGCGDCKHVYPVILKPYFESNKNSNNLYIVDLDKEIPLSEQNEFKKNTIKIAENSPYGYGENGYVPTFMTYEGSTAITGAVAYNDLVENVNGTFKVTRSYYSNDRLSTLEYLSNFPGTKVLEGIEVGETNDWNYTKADNYYKPLIETYLNYSLPKVNYSI